MDEDLIEQVKRAMLQVKITPQRKCPDCGRVLLPFEVHHCTECQKAVNPNFADKKPDINEEAPTLKYKMPFNIDLPKMQVKLKSVFSMFNIFVEDFFDKFERPTNYVPAAQNVCKNCFINDIKDLKHGIMAKEWHAQHCKRCLYNYEKAIVEKGGIEEYFDEGIVNAEFCREYPIMFSRHLKDIYKKSEVKSVEDALQFYKEMMEIIRIIEKLIKKIRVLIDIVNSMMQVGISKEEIASILSLAFQVAAEINIYKSKLIALIDIAVNIVSGASADSEALKILGSAVKQANGVEGLRDKFEYIKQVKLLAAKAGIDDSALMLKKNK